MKKFYAFLAKYAPEANKADGSVVYGYGQAQTLVQVLKQSGDTLTRENIMKQAASLKGFAPDTLLPGVTINTSATDFSPIEQLQMQQFKGREVGSVRRHHLGRSRQLGPGRSRGSHGSVIDYLRLNNAPCDCCRRGLFLAGPPLRVFNIGRSQKALPIKKIDTFKQTKEV